MPVCICADVSGQAWLSARGALQQYSLPLGKENFDLRFSHFAGPLWFLHVPRAKQALSASESNLSSQQATLAAVTRQLVTAQSSLASVETSLAAKRQELELLVRKCDQAADQEFKEGKSHLMKEGEWEGRGWANTDTMFVGQGACMRVCQWC